MCTFSPVSLRLSCQYLLLCEFFKNHQISDSFGKQTSQLSLRTIVLPPSFLHTHVCKLIYYYYYRGQSLICLLNSRYLICRHFQSYLNKKNKVKRSITYALQKCCFANQIIMYKSK